LNFITPINAHRFLVYGSDRNGSRSRWSVRGLKVLKARKKVHESGCDRSILFRAFDEGEIFLPLEKSKRSQEAARASYWRRADIHYKCVWFFPRVLLKIKLVESARCLGDSLAAMRNSRSNAERCDLAPG